MPTLLCFGDSNTYGSPPNAGVPLREPRFGIGTRWPTVCAATLGADWTLVEEGLPGRTAQFPDPTMGDHMDGRLGLKIALNSHGPIDWLAIMLGTNDVKTRFGATASGVTAGIAALIDIAMGAEVQDKHGGFNILLICPPPVVEVGVFAGEFFGARDISLGLSPLYQSLAQARDCRFLDAGDHIAVSPVDGIHYDAATHQTLGRAVAGALA
jgi:lysophospholipase L1-like esterase